MMQKTIAEIAQEINGEVVGDQNTVICGLNGIQEAQEGELTFIGSSKYQSLIKECKASAVIVARDLDVEEIPSIKADNPAIAFAKVYSLFHKDDEPQFSGVHESALIADSVTLGKNVTVGPNTVIESDVSIGDHTVISGGCYVGYDTTIGENCYFYPLVSVREKVQIGNNVIAHNGVVIGADGFGYEMDNGKHIKIPQLGTVVIEDDVEIGANSTIDRARFDKTLIGKGTKIDNLVQIGHNCIIGENCIIIAGVGMGGSTTVGKNSILAGQSGFAGHLSVGENSIVAAQAGVTHTIPANSKVTGYPAKPLDKFKRINAHLNKLEEHVQTIKDLKKRVEELESKND